MKEHMTYELLSSVEYIGWDELKNEEFIGNAVLEDLPVKIGGDKNWSKFSKSGNNQRTETHINLNCKDTDEAKKMATGCLQSNSYSFGYGHGFAEGNYKLRPGMRVKIKAVGEAYEGEYIAEMVIHKFDRQNGYGNEFYLKRNMSP